MNCSMWEHGYCPDCDLYIKGLCKGYPVKPKDENVATFQALGSSTRTEASDTQYKGLKIELELFDVENNTRRICGLGEAKTWDWKDPTIMRIIGDFQVTSFEQLLFMLREKEEKGIQKVTLREAPRFMMLSGG
jgi:hypothetical protein